MRTRVFPFLVLLASLGGCASTLLSTDVADFRDGYATLTMASGVSPSGQACQAANVLYSKRYKRAHKRWFINGPPYYAAPGNYLIGVSCPGGYYVSTGECADYIVIGDYENDLEVALESGKTYVIGCDDNETPYISEETAWLELNPPPDQESGSGQ